MTTLWKDGAFVADTFAAVDDALPLPAVGPMLVSLKRWRDDRVAVLAIGGPIGVTVEAASTLSPETDDLQKLALIVIPFAKFTDGRGYSLARRLRDEFYFRGEVRATGEVLIDQIPLMLRCGFDSFAISHMPTIRALEAGHLPAILEVYQPAVHAGARNAAGFISRRLVHSGK